MVTEPVWSEHPPLTVHSCHVRGRWNSGVLVPMLWDRAPGKSAKRARVNFILVLFCVVATQAGSKWNLMPQKVNSSLLYTNSLIESCLSLYLWVWVGDLLTRGRLRWQFLLAVCYVCPSWYGAFRYCYMSFLRACLDWLSQCEINYMKLHSWL